MNDTSDAEEGKEDSERVITLRPLNMEDMKQAKNQVMRVYAIHFILEQFYFSVLCYILCSTGRESPFFLFPYLNYLSLSLEDDGNHMHTK